MNYPKRSEIFLANLDPTIGSEIKKVRPVLIIQNNILNKYSKVVIVCPITSKVRKGQTRVFLSKKEGGLDKDSVILTQQVRCIDKRRLIKPLGEIDEEKMQKVNFALKISQGLINIDD